MHFDGARLNRGSPEKNIAYLDTWIALTVEKLNYAFSHLPSGSGGGSSDINAEEVKRWVLTQLDDKVDKVAGKVLSSNDFTDALLAKLTGIESGAEENVIEIVKKNGTALTVTGKAVDISVITMTDVEDYIDSLDAREVEY